MGPVTRAVQTGIGLAAELKAAHKERKSLAEDDNSNQTKELTAQVERLQIEEKDKENDGDDHDTADDENFGGGDPPTYSRELGATGFDDESPPPYPDEESIIMADLKAPPPPTTLSSPPRMSCPVVIPQRRPGSKTRGFVRAYAPVLADYGIDQDTFLTFLKSFHKASQASPVLNVITVGAGALGNIPEPFSMLAGIGVSVLSGTAADLQGRLRANSYLDQANELLFKPRELHCLVMSFRPDVVPKGDVAIEPVDTSKVALKWLSPPNSSFRMQASKLRDYSGKTRGEAEMPETAPLIYPDTGYAELGRRASKDATTKEDGPTEKKRSALAEHRKVAEAYFDKRAQAEYAYKHPESALATEEMPQFASKYGDPTNPSVTTSYVGRASAAIKHESLADRQARKRAKAMQARGSGTAIRRVLQGSVLYLMIVNQPTEAEMEDAREAVQQDAI